MYLTLDRTPKEDVDPGTRAWGRAGGAGSPQLSTHTKGEERKERLWKMFGKGAILIEHQFFFCSEVTSSFEGKVRTVFRPQ